MEMVTVKREESNGRRRRLEVEALPSNPIKFVKRRRRESAVAVPGAAVEDNRSEQATDTSSTTTTVKRSSKFRGVSRHRWTGRYEAHLWDKGSWNATQKKKGKQVYLGAYDEEEAAARAYDLAALKYWGPSTFTNFPVSDYDKEIEIMQDVTKEEYLASLRRKSSGFSRGVSKYRGVARHHHNGRWEARIGRVFGNKYLYLGTYSTQEEAAAAYDIAAIEYRGINAVTNFDLSTYIRWLRPKANTLSAIQEQPTSCNEPRTFPHPSTIFHKEETELFLDCPNILSNDHSGFPDQKQDCHPLQVPCTPTKSSSSTALSLLLRSSIFQELMEKNSNAAEINDVEGDDHERRFHEQQLGNEDDDFGGIFYDATATDIPYMCSLNGTTLPGIELLQEGLPSYCSVAGALDQCFERVSQSLASV